MLMSDVYFKQTQNINIQLIEYRKTKLNCRLNRKTEKCQLKRYGNGIFQYIYQENNYVLMEHTLFQTDTFNTNVYQITDITQT